MSDLIARYETLRAERAALTEQIVALAPKAFAEESKVLFAENPDLTSFGWQQYTPYFNDGDACTFGVYLDEPQVNGTNWVNDQKELSKERFEELQTTVRTFLLGYEDQLEEMFGDHTCITVTAKGLTKKGCRHD